jgi:hypothetical protein
MNPLLRSVSAQIQLSEGDLCIIEKLKGSRVFTS